MRRSGPTKLVHGLPTSKAPAKQEACANCGGETVPVILGAYDVVTIDTVTGERETLSQGPQEIEWCFGCAPFLEQRVDSDHGQ
jgi:hypothetical protein